MLSREEAHETCGMATRHQRDRGRAVAFPGHIGFQDAPILIKRGTIIFPFSSGVSMDNAFSTGNIQGYPDVPSCSVAPATRPDLSRTATA